MALYFSNCACHSASLSGGSVPATGCHSTIERPDSVSRVAPPIVTIASTSAATARSQSLMARRLRSRATAALIMRLRRCGACPRRQGPYSRVCARNRAQTERAPSRPGHAYSITQAHRCVCAHRLGLELGADRHGGGAISGRESERALRDDLLCDRRTGLGPARNAAHSLDVKRSAREDGRSRIDDRRWIRSESMIKRPRALASTALPLPPRPPARA